MSENGNGLATIAVGGQVREEHVRQLSLAEMVGLGEVMFKSGLFPDVKSAAACVVKMMAGQEMGFGPFASMADVHIIEGKPSIGAHLRAASIKRSDKYDYQIIERSDAACEIEFYELAGGTLLRKGRPGWKALGKLRYTVEEARKKGWHLTRSGQEKSPWQKTPANMLFARVLTDGYKTFCPDLSLGVLAYDPDELDVLPAPGPAVIPAAALPTPTAASPALPAASTQTAALDIARQNRLDELNEALGVEPAKFVERVRTVYGVAIDRLTAAQADELIEKYEAALRQKEAAAAGKS